MSKSAQERIKELIYKHLGEDIFENAQERGMRIVEEAVEAAQALNIPRDTVLRITDRVYFKPPGALRQEIGGVLVTTLALCQRMGWDYKEILTEEIIRFAEKGHLITEKHNQKLMAGTSELTAKGKQ